LTRTRAAWTAAAIVLVFGAVLPACVGTAIGVVNGDPARIARVERGLLPTVAIRGRTDTTYTITDRLRRYSVPGVSIAVIDEGRVAWARAYGVREAGGPEPVDTTTLFQAGSISKAVTSVAALRLVERGDLRLDENVSPRLVSWKIPPSDLTRQRPITLRGLLSHGAGLNVPSYPGYAADAPVPTLLQVLGGVPPANTPPVKLEASPGTQWRYSGGGLSIVQQLLVDVSGRPFAHVLRESVLDPAGMTRTLAEQPLSTVHAASAATGHSAGTPVRGRWRVYPELAAAGFWSTAPDLARFVVAVMHAIHGDRGALLGPVLAREMVRRQIGDWGLGFSLGALAGDSATVGHEGSTVGYTARLLLIPATGQGIAVMTNGESVALIDEIERAVAREYAWPVRPRVERTIAVVDAARLTALAGRYRVELGERTFDFLVAVEGTRLILTGPSGRPGELLPLSELRFFSQDSGYEFTFAREGNAVTSMGIDQQGQRYTARRL
jgi:CubicO group peptidase (beta-lactamase class C family)